MATTADYLNQLKTDKDNLVKNLKGKGVSASNSEKFTTLVSKVNDIEIPKLLDASYFFYNRTRCENIKSYYPLLKDATNMKGAFSQWMKDGVVVDLTGLDTSKVTNMSSMFSSNYAQEIDISPLDTSNVTDMSSMFYYCTRLKKINLGEIDTSKVTNFYNFLSNSQNIEEIDLSKLDTSSAINMSGMLSYQNELKEINVSSFDTSKVTNMSSMFANSAKNITNFDLSNFNTSKVTNMSMMFYGCMYHYNLDLSAFDTSNVTDMSNMFGFGQYYTGIDLSSFNTSKVIKFNGMFSNWQGTTGYELNLNNFNFDKAEDLTGMFSGSTRFVSIDLSGMAIPKKYASSYHYQNMFNGCTNLKKLNIKNATFSNLTSSISNFMTGVPTDCEIIVKDDTEKTWWASKYPTYTNVKTVAEYEVNNGNINVNN